MGWSIGWDSNWKRDVGYDVPATCDHPGCDIEIDRGLGYVCGGAPYGGEHGCGLYFCTKHLTYYGRRHFGAPGGVLHMQLCERCGKKSKKGPFEPTPDVPEWLNHKLTDESWGPWRAENPDEVTRITALLAAAPTK